VKNPVMDGNVFIEQEDDHISGPAPVGVWTTADSITAFDDLTYSAASR
jgi:hypothetical protein